MQLRAEDIRPGHRIDGTEVLWARPIADYTTVCIALESISDETADGNFRWYRPDQLVELDDSERRASQTRPV